MIQKSILSICLFFVIFSRVKSEYFGKICTSDEECESGEILMDCQAGKCSCYSSDMYNEITKKCEARVGYICNVPKNPCVGNATCSFGLFQLTRRCICNDGFKSTANETCIEMTPDEVREKNATGYLGKVCNSGTDCENPTNFLLCKANNTCGCSVLDNYDPISKMCRARVGNACFLPKNPCVEKANCIGSKCVCDTGYKKSIEETCIRRTAVDTNDIDSETDQILGTTGYFGKTCSSNKDCESDTNFLLCKDSVCKCSNLDNYDEISKICRARAGNYCFLPLNPCIENANCVSKNCECKPGFKEVNELCEPMISSISHPNSFANHLSEPIAFERLVLNDTIYVHHTHDYPQNQSNSDIGWIIAFIFLLGCVTLTLGYLLMKKYQNSFSPSISYKRHNDNPESSNSNNIHITDKY